MNPNPAPNPFIVNVAKEFAMTGLLHSHTGSPEFGGNTTAKGSAAPSSAPDDARPLAGMLLAAAMAALLVIADQVIDGWADGHYLAAWVALWTVTFAALAFLAPPLRKWSNAGAEWLLALKQQHDQARAEEAMWELARYDHRVMQEIRMASLRQLQG